jgi:type VII secretion protein EccB
MESRRDQVHAYFYVVSRLNTAVMQGRPDPYEPPNRRPMLGFVVGMLLAVVVAGGFGIYGIFRPGGEKAWRQAGTIITVKETGGRYLLLDGQLRPVLNYASARLVLGTETDAKLVAVARTTLKGVAVGAPIGISGAPDSIPAANRLYNGPWTVCAQPVSPAGKPATTLILGAAAGPKPVDAGHAFLVRTPDGQVHLIWQGIRFRLNRPAAVAMGYAAVDPILVTPAWLNPIPAGRDLTYPVVAGRGRAGPLIGGRTSVIGQIFEVRNPASGATEQFVARADGLLRLSRTAAVLMLADPGIGRAYPGGDARPVPVRPDELAQAIVVTSNDFIEGYPPDPPVPVNGDGRLPCVGFRSSGKHVNVTLSRIDAEAVSGALPVPRATAVGATVDRVLITAGTGVVARNPYAPGAAGGATFLVTEFGAKYPLPPAGVQALGYASSTPVEVPAELLELLPTGPVLEPAAALRSQVLGG